MANILDAYLDEISSWYPKGMIPWLKRSHPDKWDELLALEKELNRASLDRDEVKTEELLTQYRDFVRSMANGFEAREKGQGQGELFKRD